jgi:hypothetical protein
LRYLKKESKHIFITYVAFLLFSAADLVKIKEMNTAISSLNGGNQSCLSRDHQGLLAFSRDTYKTLHLRGIAKHYGERWHAPAIEDTATAGAT